MPHVDLSVMALPRRVRRGGVECGPLSTIELTGVRKHPDAMVAESCGSGLKAYKAADKPDTQWIGPPDPMMLAMGTPMGSGGPVKISPDGKSMIMTALNDNWVWTYTPSAK